MNKIYKKIITILLITANIIIPVNAMESYNNLSSDAQASTEQISKQIFWDVNNTYWAFDYITELNTYGVINGYPDGSFKPENTITRAEWAKIMIQLSEIKANDNSVKFKDVKDHWALPYINAVSDFLTPYSDNTYMPDKAITREEATMAMVKLKGYNLEDVDYSILSKFKDAYSISDFMKIYVAVAIEKGLIKGFEDNTFRGTASLTRAEASTLLLRAFPSKKEVSDNVIEITSADELRALSRILMASWVQKNVGVTSEKSLEKFNTPEDLTTTEQKISYLQSAHYKLMNNIEIKLTESAGFFLGIGGLYEKPFKGTFDGNNKVITLTADSEIAPWNGCYESAIGLFGSTENAKIYNLNLEVNSDIIFKQSTTNKLDLGVLVGNAKNTTFDNCTVNFSNSNFGAIYPDDMSTSNISQTNVGGMVGFSTHSTYNNCSVNTTNSTIIAKALNNTKEATYGLFSVGGFLGFSGAGSDNTTELGKLGNQLYNCSFTSNNSVQRDVLLAQVNTGNEMVAGGLIGCSFNNLLVENSNVNVTKGNIAAIKTGNTDKNSMYGTQAGGIIGRLEHTGEINGCNVTGNYLIIISKSPQNRSTAGGIVGESIGARHREIIDIYDCHFDGLGTSSIKLEITSNDFEERYSAVGGIAGYFARIENSSVKNVDILNFSKDAKKSYIGNIAGIISTPINLVKEGIYNTTFSNVNLYSTDNVINNNYPIN